jgi:uncharacterized cupin superfamily protein
MNRHIINIDEINLEPRSSAFSAKEPPRDRFDARIGPIAARIGAQKLGYNLTAVPPGKRAFPIHNHRVNEEMFFILEGEGQVRIGKEVHPIRKGDLIACPPGGEEVAHQIINTGTVELRYLAVSTKLSPEVVDYPDSKKFGVLAELGPGADGKPQFFRYVGRRELSVDYWDGE